jgi:cell wall assembly regulator SMI1
MSTILEEILGSCEVPGPASAKLIASAEQLLGLSFPAAYRKFLCTYGAALGQGFSIAGLVEEGDNNSPPYWDSVVRGTLLTRKASRGRIPHAYLALSGDGGDYSYYLDTQQPTASGECAFVVLGPGAHSIVIARTFAEFVKRLAVDDFNF